MVVYIIIVSALMIGALMIWLSLGHRSRKSWKIRPSRSLTDAVLKLKDSGQDEVFLQAGVRISMEKYTAIRNLLIICLLIFTGLYFVRNGFIASRGLILMVAVLFFLSYPAKHFSKRKLRTPFQMMLDLLTQHRRETMDDELYKLITQLKNLIVTQKNHAWSADYYLATLLRASVHCKPVFAQTLSKMRQGDAGAFSYFSSTIGTTLGQDFAGVLQKLDVLDPQELLAQITTFQSIKREDRRTLQIHKQERAGQILFMLASFLFFIIIVDFMYIVFADLMQAMIF